MENLSFQYPTWLALICLLVALLYVVFLYWKSKPSDANKTWLNPSLMLLRFLPILTIGLLLLGPMLKQIFEESKQPSIVILHDNSQSIGSWLALEDGHQTLSTSLDALATTLTQKYNIDTYTFGESVVSSDSDTLGYDASLTNISEALKYVVDIFEGENLGSIILATDGIYNTGQNPLYTSLPANIPIHSIALGDTSKRRDAIVQTVLHNEVAYLNDEMITQVDIKAINASNQPLTLTIERESNDGYEIVEKKTINVRGEDFFAMEEVQLSFKQTGIQHYRYRISSLNNEINRTNNRKDVYVEVLDARQEIGIICAAPHPDVTAIKQILEQNKNYKVNTFYEQPDNTELAGLDLVIFHNLPGAGQNLKSILNSLNNRRTPRMYILGDNVNLAQFSDLQSLVDIKGKKGSSNDAQGSIDPTFENFTLSDRFKTSIKNYPPMASPFGEYNLSGNVRTLLYQNIGEIETDFPLLSFADVDGIKTTFLFGNDIWRWKLFDYLQNENFDLVSELLEKSIIYTSTKEDKRKFRVNTNSNVLMTNNDVIFTAELYNNSYELVNGPEITMKLTSGDGSSYDYTFSKNSKTYGLDIGSLNAGNYSYQAETIFNGEQYHAEGKFVVREIQFELYDLEAQHNLLYALSEKTQGSVRYLGQLQDLSTELLNADHIKPVIYQNNISKPLLDNKWLFLLIVLPLMLEWLLRRYFGSL